MARNRTVTLLALALAISACRPPAGYGGGGGGGVLGVAADDDPTSDPTADPDPTGMGGGASSSSVVGRTGPMASSEDPCLTMRPTPGHQGTDGPDVIRGSSGPDVIFGGSGDDLIFGNGGDDVICAGGGEDTVEGGDGEDYIDGGFGQDELNGGARADVIHGRSGGDTIHGNDGNDRLYGDILDDHLYGDDGDDLLIGGHGVDYMHGGPGDDWLRGDTNKDELIGGSHTGQGDTVSFMTTTPPGQGITNRGLAGVAGILVDNRDPEHGMSGGDGASEPMVGFEVIKGSAFDDHIMTGAGTALVSASYGDDVLDGPAPFDVGRGNDVCNGAPCGVAPDVRDGNTLVFLSRERRDLGLGAIGGAGDDVLTFSVGGGFARVRSESGPLVAGDGCTLSADQHLVECRLEYELRYIMGYGGDGNDELVLAGDFPRDMESTLDGGRGNDVLIGHQGQDILFAGPDGMDSLEGRGGDDALISESRDTDVMDAGPGNDQLVANWPCAGHIYIGGTGMDVAGFARVGNFETAAERRRQSIHAQIGGRSWQPAFCAQGAGTQVRGDTEILEGAGGDDELIGSDGDDIIWGREGNDLIRGLGGNDTLEGLSGDDEIFGGGGRDRLRGGNGRDVLHAADGETDLQVWVGSGGCVADRDPSDPTGPRCMTSMSVSAARPAR